MRSRDYVKEFRRLLWERGGRVCGICTLPLELSEVTVDHIVSIAIGGPDVWENMQAAHKPCNSRKGTKAAPDHERTYVYATLHLGEKLHDAVTRLADSENRSMHGQIVHLIEQATGAKDSVKRRVGRRRPARPTVDDDAGGKGG